MCVCLFVSAVGLTINKVKETSTPGTPYYHNPELYSIERFCFYKCFKCQVPYYGGERQCGAPVQAEDFDPSELICGGCAGAGANCKKHGAEYIEYKCRYCCNVAR